MMFPILSYAKLCLWHVLEKSEVIIYVFGFRPSFVSENLGFVWIEDFGGMGF